jgi:hypothetical protein
MASNGTRNYSAKVAFVTPVALLRSRLLERAPPMNFAHYFQREPRICVGETVLRGKRNACHAADCLGELGLLLTIYCGIIHPFLRNMSALSSLLPLLPQGRIYQCKGRLPLSEVKLDENIPVSIAEVLTPLDHDVHTVTGEGLTGRADQEKWTQLT